MRWTLVTETYPPEVNGVAMTLERLVCTMAAQGHSVSLVRPRQKADRRASVPATASVPMPVSAAASVSAAVPMADAAAAGGSSAAPHGLQPHTDFVLGLPIPGYSGLCFGRFATRRLRSLWRRNRPDVVHIATEGPLGFSALHAARSLGIPVVTTFHTNFHSYGEHYRLGIFKRPLIGYLRWFHNATLATFAPSEDVIGQLRNAGFERLHLMGRGVDTALFGPHRRSAALRREWGVAEGLSVAQAPVVLYVGRVAAEKNLPLAIRAFDRLRTHLPDARMVVVGDGPLRARLQKERPDIHFAGMRRGEDLAAHYASADLFFFASITETFGNVVTEAMASGLVVLAYDYAAPGRYIENGQNGFTAAFDDEAAYLGAVDAVAAAAPNWSRIGAAAAATMQSLSWNAIIGSYAAQVQSTVAATGSGVGGGSSVRPVAR